MKELRKLKINKVFLKSYYRYQNYNKLNLIDQKSTFNFLKKKKPDFVIHLAARLAEF